MWKRPAATRAGIAVWLLVGTLVQAAAADVVRVDIRQRDDAGTHEYLRIGRPHGSIARDAG